jgi:cardiolipin synthase A/B
VIGGIFFFYVWLVLAASYPALPDPENPVLFYSNQTRQDIKRIFCKALQNAKHSIFLSFYGISDPQILTLLSAKKNTSIRVEFDPSASVNLKNILPPSIDVIPLKVKGLMHRKIATFDHAQVFLGSANLTTTSLRHHANLVLGLYSPPLASFLEHPTTTSFAFTIETLSAELYLLPDPEETGIKRLIDQIQKAKKNIRIAMFTLTHPALSAELTKAKKRGVDVCLCIDYYTARGASKKTLTAMEKEGVQIFLSQGRELLHHKWAIVDEETLIMGSANWTRAAFSKNHDFLLFLFSLDQKKINYLNKLWKMIKEESVPSIETNQSL